jgi:hypothetical protein
MQALAESDFLFEIKPIAAIEESSILEGHCDEKPLQIPL